MVIVANAGPLLSCARAHRCDRLRAVVATLLMPHAVYADVVVHGTGKPGGEEVRHAPGSTRPSVSARAFVAQLPQHLHRGERAALALAQERNGALLIEEREARRAARPHGLAHVGSLRLLEEAQHRGLIPAGKPLLDALMAAGTSIRDTLYRAFLRDGGEEAPHQVSGEERTISPQAINPSKNNPTTIPANRSLTELHDTSDDPIRPV
jgi:uncharacterized protein